jgi:predicted 2-oxoglutarate/Fe(II)-dependent dioxygenase YbiX
MMNICDIALVIKNHLNDDECQQLIKEYERKKITAIHERSFDSYEEKTKVSTFKKVNIPETNRHYDLIKSKTADALKIWLDYLQSKNMFSVAVLRNNLQYTTNDFRILKYDVGNFIHPHTDWYHFTHASVSLNLNDEYTGGDFVFMNGERTISLEKGDALVFPANFYWVHETTPILTGSRYTVNSFISSVHSSSQQKLVGEVHKAQQEHERIFKL